MSFLNWACSWGGVGVDRAIFVSASDIRAFRLPTDLAGITHVKYDIVDNKDVVITPACERIRQHITKISTVKGLSKKERKDLSYAGAICFKVVDGEIQYLIVSTTQGRSIFPKGDVKDREDNASEAAQRIALKEGGARGRIVPEKSIFVNYLNEQASAIHRIEVFLIDTSKNLNVSEKYRRPRWMSLNEAVTSVSFNRDVHSKYELVKALEWADAEIIKYIKPFKKKQIS